MDVSKMSKLRGYAPDLMIIDDIHPTKRQNMSNNTEDLYTTGDICKLLGLNVSADFIKDTLKVEPVVSTRVGVYWYKPHFGRICYALSVHCHRQALKST
jgi:hypothetical protein